MVDPPFRNSRSQSPTVVLPVLASLPSTCRIDEAIPEKNLVGLRLAEMAGLAPNKFYAARKDCRDLDTGWVAKIATSIFEHRNSRFIRGNQSCATAGSLDENHACRRLTPQRTVADRIDVGCDPARRCGAIGDYVAASFKTDTASSIDTFDSWGSETVDPGLVASPRAFGNSLQPFRSAVDWGARRRRDPDTPDDLNSLDETIRVSPAAMAMPCRLDSDPRTIGSGFARVVADVMPKQRRRYSRARDDEWHSATSPN